MKAFVPDLAIVPRFVISSCFVIPIPVSWIVSVVCLVRDYRDLERRLILDQFGVRQRLVPDLVQRVRGIRNQLPQEDLLVRVKGVDDQAHQLSNFRLEGECFSFSHSNVSRHDC